jgi:hypothetical protein
VPRQRDPSPLCSGGWVDFGVGADNGRDGAGRATAKILAKIRMSCYIISIRRIGRFDADEPTGKNFLFGFVVTH